VLTTTDASKRESSPDSKPSATVTEKSKRNSKTPRKKHPGKSGKPAAREQGGLPSPGKKGRVSGMWIVFLGCKINSPQITPFT
jgi:hypothetical protein